MRFWRRRSRSCQSCPRCGGRPSRGFAGDACADDAAPRGRGVACLLARARLWAMAAAAGSQGPPGGRAGLQVTGTITLRLTVSGVNGRVESVQFLADTLVPLPREDPGDHRAIRAAVQVSSRGPQGRPGVRPRPCIDLVALAAPPPTLLCAAPPCCAAAAHPQEQSDGCTVSAVRSRGHPNHPARRVRLMRV